MARILIFDTTLRDGEQSPGASMTAGEKLRMAHEIAGLGVDVIEAGFAASSLEDAEAIGQVAREVRGPVVAALARASTGDVEAAARSLEAAPRPRIHTFIATSDIHLSRKLRISRDECLERAARAIELARTLVDDVEFSAEDAIRSDLDFLCEVVRVAVEAGATTINVPDTVGYALPGEMSRTVRTLLERVPGLSERVVSAHCHNDLGLAVANSIAAVEAGARQVECTVNGIGERAGNAALEEIVMALRVRSNAMGHDTGVKSEGLYRASRMLAHLTGIHPQPNKAVVGRNAFSHEAGIHQHGMLQDPGTYEIMTPALVGQPASELVLGRHSGRHGLEARFKKLGYSLTHEELDRVTRDFKELAKRKKDVLDEDLLSLLHYGVMDDVPEVHHLESLEVVCGGEVSRARITLMSEGGVPRTAQGEGDGPISATFAATDKLTDFNVVIEDLQLRAATPGRDAMGEVSLRARIDGQTFTGRGGHTDVVFASARAYLHAINKAEQARILEARGLARAGDLWGV
jgi:2-isopropylmalate synthase